MRGKGAIGACIGLALLTAGCDTTDVRYFRYGIGTDLYPGDIVATTDREDVYLAELCRQSSPVMLPPDGPCIGAAPTDWSLIVQAGLNDIDRRCDGYLAWLDDRRRTNAAILKQIADTAFASQGLLRLAGVGADPITMVGLALGLAANTFTNINSRLLLEIDKTTVQTLVLHRRADFRLDIAAARFNNRPSAIHALRQYLNICTPFAIETDINSTVTVFQQGGAAAIDRRGPLITPATVNAAVRAGTIANVREVPIVPFRPKGVDTAKLFFTQVQDALCVADRSGALNPATEAAIRDYLVGVREISAGATTPIGISPRVRILLNRALDEVPSCQQMGFMGAFEVGRYGVGTAAARRAAIASLQEGLRSQLKIAAGDLNSGELDAKTREAIVRFRTEKSLRPTLGGRVDAELLARVRE